MSLFNTVLDLAWHLLKNKKEPQVQVPSLSDTPKQFLSNREMEQINKHISGWQATYKKDPKPVDILRLMHGWLENFKSNHTKIAFGVYKSEMHDYIAERLKKVKLRLAPL